MKKGLLLFIFTTFLGSIHAQSLGFSGGLTYVRSNFIGNPQRQPDTSRFGGRIEFTYLRNGSENLVKYKSFGFEYFIPFRDSGLVTISTVGNDRRIKTIAGRSAFTFSYRFGFEIPQDWNDFLMINAGLGAGIFTNRTHFDIDSMGPSDQMYNYHLLRYPANSFGVRGKPGKSTAFSSALMPEIFVNVFYEFEKFYLVGTYTFRYIVDFEMGFQLQHTINLGIYYPLIQL